MHDYGQNLYDCGEADSVDELKTVCARGLQGRNLPKGSSRRINLGMGEELELEVVRDAQRAIEKKKCFYRKLIDPLTARSYKEIRFHPTFPLRCLISQKKFTNV